MLTRYQKLPPFLRTFTLPLALVLSQAAVTTAMAGSCVATSSGAASCAIPAGVNTVAVVATGAGGGGGAVGVGGHGGVVTATLTGVSGATLGLYVGGGGSGSTQGGGGGGGSSNVSMNGSVQIVAGGGGGGGFGSGYGSDAGSNGNGGRTDFYSGAGGNGGVSGYGVNGGQPGGSGAGGAGGSGCGPTGATGAGGGGGSGSGAGFGGAGGDQFSSGAFGGGGGGGGGHGGGGGGGSGGGGGGGGGSVGGTLSVASNGGAARQGGADGSILVTWSDAGPVAIDVRINGVPQLGAVLTGSYTYSSAAGAAQGNSVFRWMSDTNSDGQSKRPIGGATSTTYSPTLAEGGNYLFFCVTPVAQTGTLTGNEACSIGVPFTLLAPSQASTNVLGIGPNKVAPLDLNTGFGPTLTGCLTDAVRQFLGKDAQYAGQTSGGSARMAQGGGVISFYALNASGNASEGQGLRLLASNALTVRTACGSLDVAPALFNPAEVGLTVAALGLSASIDATGLLVVAGNGNVYVMRPDYQVLPGSAPGAGLQKDTDGNYRFVDSKGYGQVLRAAFLSPSTLQALAGSALGGTIVIQTDGTALLTAFDGSQSVLEPDLALGAIPQAHSQSNWWADGPNRFRYVFGLYSQGLTVRAK